jgi:hypothetical protein
MDKVGKPKPMTVIAPEKVISTILKHDSKVTSYKIALLRADQRCRTDLPRPENLRSPCRGAAEVTGEILGGLLLAVC